MPKNAKKKVNLNFRSKKTVVLEEPKPVKKEKVTARNVVKTAPEVPVARPMKTKKEKTVVQPVVVETTAVVVKPLAAGRLQSLLESLCARATTGEFRGRKEKPSVVLTMGEMQALTQCLVECQARNTAGSAPEENTTKSKRRSAKVA